MKLTKFSPLFLLILLIGKQSFSQSSMIDIVMGTNNEPINAVEFVHNGDTTRLIAGVMTNTVATTAVNLNYFEINGGTRLYPYDAGNISRNNNFPPNVMGVGIHEENNFILATDSAFTSALEDMANSPDLMQFLYYDGATNIPDGGDFDIAFVRGYLDTDFISVGERNGNTDFVLIPLDEFGNVIANADSVRFGEIAGTSSGNGTTRYDWDIGFSPSNLSTQSMIFSVISADLFNTGGEPIFGFRIDNEGDADVKIMGLTETNFDNNPINPQIGGIMGNVFHDADGLTDSTVDGPAINSPSGMQLYANLYDPNTNEVIATTPINADGTFEFLNLPEGQTYGVAISINEGVPGSPLPVSELPSDWIFTGDNDGATAGDDGTPNGIQSAVVVTTSINDEINFAIQQPPTADPYTFPIPEPIPDQSIIIGSGTTSDLSGNDPEDGVVETGNTFGITSLPTNGNDILYNGMIITLGADGINPISPTNPFIIDNYDPALLEIIISGDLSQTSTTFEYITIDDAGAFSEPVEYTLTFDSIELPDITGNIFNDADGLTDATVDGPTISDPDGSPLYANLYDPVTGDVLESVAIDMNGYFEFLDLDPNMTYGVSISTIQGVAGSPVPAEVLPDNWMYTGENDGSTSGDDGTPNGNQPGVILTNINNDEINFGIQEIPEADPYSFGISNPAPNSSITIGSGATSDLSGSDPEDGTLGTTSSFAITGLPTNGNDIVYDGMVIEFGADGINPPSPTNPFVIDSYDPALLEITFNGDLSQMNTTFQYASIDEAGAFSDPVDYTLTFDSIELPDITGNIFNDADGLTDATVDGPTISDPDGQTLYANLYDPVTGDVLESVAIDMNGYFEFLDLDPNMTYGVSISTIQGVAGSPVPAEVLPDNWMYTGENDGSTSGDDGTPNGNQPGVILTNINNDEINFGIQEIPEADPYSFGISNPAPNSSITIGSGATSDLSGSDPEDGTLGTTSSFAITGLPTNGNDIVYDGMVIEFGADGINPPSPTNPFVIDSYDPALLEIIFNGDPSQTSTTFQYASIDEAGAISDPVDYMLSFSSLPVEWLYFEATKQDNSTKLNFATATEINNSHFIVQRSNDGIKFEDITQIEGQINSLEVNEYSFLDREVYSGLNYYRVKQVDLDGTYSYSVVRIVTFERDTEVLVYPNPIRPGESTLNLQLSDDSEITHASIYNILGIKVMDINFDDQVNSLTKQIEVRNLTIGTYIISYEGNAKSTIFTVVE